MPPNIKNELKKMKKIKKIKRNFMRNKTLKYELNRN